MRGTQTAAMSLVRLGLCGSVLVASLFAVTEAQQPPAAPPQQPAAPEAPPDPRVGLKPGIDDAGVAALNLELVGHLPKPEAFSDPTGGFSLNFANSDLAFKGTHLYLGNFHGFNFYNIEDPRKPELRVSVPCPGGQGDLSVYRNLMFMSVEQTRGRIDCGTQGVEAPVSAERFRGVRIFDISNLEKPRQIAAVQTCRGSHTHTLLVDPKDTSNVYIYGSGTSSVRSAEELAGCSGLGPERSQYGPLQHRRDSGAARLARAGACRESATDLRRSEDRRGRGTLARRRSRPRHAALVGHQSVPRRDGVSGNWSRRGRLFGQRHPARHLRPGEPGAARSRVRPELRVLALRDVQQRRHQGRVYRRVGRRDTAALSRDRPADVGRQRDLRHRQPQAPLRRVLQAAGARRPSRKTASRTTDRSSRCPGATSWCRAGIRAA